MLDCSKASSTLGLRIDAIYSHFFRITNLDTHSERQLRLNVAVTMTAAKVMKKTWFTSLFEYANCTHFLFDAKSADEMGNFEQAANPTHRSAGFDTHRSAGFVAIRSAGFAIQPHRVLGFVIRKERFSLYKC